MAEMTRCRALEQLKLEKDVLVAMIFENLDVGYKDERVMIERVKFARPYSWDLCYEYFKNHSKFLHDPQSEENDWERAAADLAAYLASFGMYTINGPMRAVSRLMLVEFIKKFYREIAEARFITYDEIYNSNGIIAQENLLKLFNIAKRVFESSVVQCHYHKKKYVAKDVMISKILMGIMGVMPAYDSCFEASIEKYNTFRDDKEKVKKSLCGYVEETISLVNDDEVRNYLREEFTGIICKKDDIDNYPIMRLLDLHLWAWGKKKRRDDRANSKL